MKTHKLSLVGYVIGLMIMFSSIVRWGFIYSDPSQTIMGVSIGILIIILSYIYHWMRETDVQLQKDERRMDAIVMWWQKQEKEEVKNIALGN